MTLRLIAYLTSLAGIFIIVAGHVISASYHDEVYLICAVSYWLRACSLLDGVHSENLLTGSLWIFITFVIVLGSLGIALISSGVTLFIGPNRALLRVNFLSYYFSGIIIAVGLFLVSANHGISGVKGADEISLTSNYFVLPLALALIGGIYHLLWTSTEPAPSGRPPVRAE